MFNIKLTFKLRLYISGNLSDAEFEQDLATINNEINLFKKSIDEFEVNNKDINCQRISITKEEVKKFHKNIAMLLSTKNESKRLKVKEILQLVVDKIEIIDRSKADMKIVLKFDDKLYRPINTHFPKNIEFSFKI